jgi:hypothetical protein
LEPSYKKLEPSFDYRIIKTLRINRQRSYFSLLKYWTEGWCGLWWREIWFRGLDLILGNLLILSKKMDRIFSKVSSKSY